MSRKRKPKAKKSPAVKSIAEREAEASSLLEREHYREAIAAYKQLLKTEQREEWRQQLAQVYLLRAQVIAAKGMYQEAAVLWDHYHSFSQQLQAAECYVQWLLLAKKYNGIATFQRQHSSQLEPALLRRIQVLLGALLLAGEALDDALLVDQLGTKHYPLARAALQAYGDGDAIALDHCLDNISFRSPYRDFRSLLKALSVREDDAPRAQQLLGRIAPESAYYPLAQLCLTQSLDDRQALLGYVQLGPYQQALVQRLCGLGAQQSRVLQSVKGALVSDAPKAVIDNVVKNRDFFGLEKSQAFCQAMLSEYPAGSRQIRHIFPVDDFEYLRLEALRDERSHPFGANGFWSRCIEYLRVDVPGNALKIALIQRHMAALIDSIDPDEAIELLGDSLELDPDDKDCLVALLALQEQQGAHADRLKILQRALQRFPQDVDILGHNIRASIGKKAFKQAAGFARKVLTIDPINKGAKEALIACHSAHARKLIRAGKADLATKELAQAAAIEQSKSRTGQVQVLEGLLAFKSGDKARSRSSVEEALGNGQGELITQFFVLIETLILELPLSAVIRVNAGPRQDYVAERQELVALLVFFESYQDAHSALFAGAFDKLKKGFKRSLSASVQTFSANEALNYCHFFESIGNFEMLRFITGQVLKHHPESPILVYYQILGKTNGGANELAYGDRVRLMCAQDRAGENEDLKTARRIDSFLDEFYSGQTDFPFGRGGILDLMSIFADDEDEDEDEEDEAFEELLERFTEISNDFGQMSPEEQLRFLFGGRPPSRQELIKLERQGEEGFINRMFERMMQHIGADQDDYDEFRTFFFN